MEHTAKNVLIRAVKKGKKNHIKTFRIYADNLTLSPRF